MWKTRTSNSSVHRAETVWKLHQSISFLGMYALLAAVYVHFYCFIDLAINSHTKPCEFDFEESVLSLDYPCPGRGLLEIPIRGQKHTLRSSTYPYGFYQGVLPPPPLYTPTGLCIVEIIMYVYLKCTVLWLFLLTIFFSQTITRLFIRYDCIHRIRKVTSSTRQTLCP